MGNKELKRMAKELDTMPKDVTSDEADLLESVLERIEEGKRVKPGDAERLQKMYDKYLAAREEGQGSQESSSSEEDPDLEEEIEE